MESAYNGVHVLDDVNFEVHRIELDGAISVDYSVYSVNGSAKRVKIKLYDRPHEDFYAAYENIKECFRQMFGLPLADKETGEELKVSLKKIVFVSKADYGKGMKITAEVSGISKHSSPMKFTTLPFYETEMARVDTGKETIGGCKIYEYIQKLSGFQLLAMRRIQEEAFWYAFCGKKEQPTLEEAAVEAGYMLEGKNND